MKVICINDKNKPKIIPNEEWVVEGKVYTVEKVIPLGLKPGRFGYILKEVKLSEESSPYETYATERFGIIGGVITAEGKEVSVEEYFAEPEVAVNVEEVNLAEI